MKTYKTAESVSPKHPDKMCDQISDAILDWCLKQDPMARVAVEVMGGHGSVYVVGEITTEAAPITMEELERIVERITGKSLSVTKNIVTQSSEIANGVDTGGAGDQGIMVGYACRGNAEMIPREHYLARHLCKWIYSDYPFDGKTQITIDDNGGISTIVASFQNVSKKDLEERVNSWILLNAPAMSQEYVIHANPAGDWNLGGFDADTGLTGRKLIVDNYSPQVPIGGGCFSGKDATKVDRSAAYMARKIAVDYLNLLPEANEVFVKLAYAIGIAEPVMATVELQFEDRVERMTINPKSYDLTPLGIINELKLREPIFEETARWGHFGNGFAWDK